MRTPKPDFWSQKNQQWMQEWAQLPLETRQALDSSQAPKALWLGCVDSRVNPSQILALNTGEVLIHRNMGNVYDEESATATLEFAVEQLGIRSVLLCGHYGCGAVQGAMQLQPELNPQSAAERWLKKHICVSRNIDWDQACREHTLAQYHQLIQSSSLSRLARLHGPIEIRAFMYRIETGALEPLAHFEAQQPVSTDTN